MRRHRVALVAAVMLAVAAFAAAGDMTLTRTGDLYRIAPADDGLLISVQLANGETVEHIVPQTEGTATSAVNLAVDPVEGGIFVLWQQGEDTDAVVNFAGLVDGTWTGPVVLSGGGSTAAANPQMMYFRAVDVIEEEVDGEIIEIEVATSFLHTTWWSYTDSLDDGDAFYQPLPLDDDGYAELDAYDAVMLSDLLPYGIHCDGIENASALAAPRLFSDPQSGYPHILAADFAECLFYILQLANEVSIDPISERRRHTIILRHGGTMPVDADLSLQSTDVTVGHDLSLVLHWDADAAIEYIQLDQNGSSGVMSLPLGESLGHEQAVELIRNLAR